MSRIWRWNNFTLSLFRGSSRDYHSCTTNPQNTETLHGNFVYQFLRVGDTSRCSGFGVGTVLRYHYFVVVPEITTRVVGFALCHFLKP